MIFDRGAKFSADVISTVKQNGTEPVRTAFRSPWQNGIAERAGPGFQQRAVDGEVFIAGQALRRRPLHFMRQRVLGHSAFNSRSRFLVDTRRIPYLLAQIQPHNSAEQYAPVEGRGDHVLATMGEPPAVQEEAVTASGDRCGVTHREIFVRAMRSRMFED